MKSKKSSKKKSSSRVPKKSLVELVRGSSSIFILLFVIVAGAIMLSGGVFPKEQPEIEENQTEYIIDEKSLPNTSKKALQLQTLKFKSCASTITIDLLLDRSDSMGSETPTGEKKLERMKEAVLALVAKLNDQSIIGVQSFNSVSRTNNVPVSYYKDVKGILPGKIEDLDHDGETPTQKALAYSYEVLKEALPKFPDRKFNFVLISDGAPVPPTQDPRLFDPNPADQIKSLGVNVYTIGIFDPKQAKDEKLANLLRSIASKPENYLEAKSGDETTALLTSITEKICE